jgi:hypothetical protein
MTFTSPKAVRIRHRAKSARTRAREQERSDKVSNESWCTCCDVMLPFLHSCSPQPSCAESVNDWPDDNSSYYYDNNWLQLRQCRRTVLKSIELITATIDTDQLEQARATLLAVRELLLNVLDC